MKKMKAIKLAGFYLVHESVFKEGVHAMQIQPKERHHLSSLVLEKDADRSLREIQHLHRFILFHRLIGKKFMCFE